MRLLKIGLRFWITLTSVVSFLAGWVMLAHSPKPVQPNAGETVSAVPTLAPLPPLDFSAGGSQFQNLPLMVQQSPRSFSPSFRSGGS